MNKNLADWTTGHSASGISILVVFPSQGLLSVYHKPKTDTSMKLISQVSPAQAYTYSFRPSSNNRDNTLLACYLYHTVCEW